MSQTITDYQADLIRQSITVLGDCLTDLKRGEELTEYTSDNLILVLSFLEDVRDIAFAENEEEQIKIMNKWL